MNCRKGEEGIGEEEKVGIFAIKGAKLDCILKGFESHNGCKTPFRFIKHLLSFMVLNETSKIQKRF